MSDWPESSLCHIPVVTDKYFLFRVGMERYHIYTDIFYLFAIYTVVFRAPYLPGAIHPHDTFFNICHWRQ